MHFLYPRAAPLLLIGGCGRRSERRRGGADPTYALGLTIGATQRSSSSAITPDALAAPANAGMPP